MRRTDIKRLAGLLKRHAQAEQARLRPGIAERIAVSPRTVGAHIQHIFDRLDIGCSAHDNRRVLAVLAYLNAK